MSQICTDLSEVAVARRGELADGCGCEDQNLVFSVGEWRVAWCTREGGSDEDIVDWMSEISRNLLRT